MLPLACAQHGIRRASRASQHPFNAVCLRAILAAMNDSQGGPPAGSEAAHKVISIVRELEQRRAKEARARASASHLRQAESAVETSENEMALEALDLDAGITWLERDPSPEGRVSWSEVRSLRALRRCMHGDTEAGLAEWAEVIAAEPKIANTYLIRARWLGSADPAVALPDYDRAVEAEPNNPTVYARRGDCYRVLGDHDRALANYRRAVGLDPTLFDVHYCMATVLATQGAYKEALNAFNTAIRLAPRYVDFYLSRAAVHEKLGDLAGAIRDQQRVLELDPKRDDVRSHLALCRGKTGDLSGALQDATKLLEGDLCDDPGAHELITVLGGILFTMGQREKALDAFNRSLALAPTSVNALAQRGRTHWELGNYEQALNDYEAALGMAPDDPDHHVGRSKALAKLGRMADAVVAASRAIAIAPDHVLAHRVRAVYRSHAEEGEEASAAVKADLARAVELIPSSVIYCHEYVDYLMDCGDISEALTAIEKTLGIVAESGGEKHELAALYYLRGACKSRLDEEALEKDPDYEEDAANRDARCVSAIADLEKAVELGQVDEDVYFELVRVREVMGDKEGLRFMLDRALVAVPDCVPLLTLRLNHRQLRGDEEGAAADRAHLAELGLSVEPT